MRIKLSPQRRDDKLTASVSGDVLTVNGLALDFGPLPDGATLPAGAVSCEWITGAVTRGSGQIELTMILPHGHNPSNNVAFPLPIIAGDGPVTLPIDTNAKEPADD